MSYLYGDSTYSKLEVNYIEFLRDAVEFCAEVLLAEQRIAQGRAHVSSLEHAATTEGERLQKLGVLVSRVFDGAPLGAAESASARCAAAIQHSASDLIRAEGAALRTTLDAEIVKRDTQAVQERDGCVKALEALLVKHDLPDMGVDLHLVVSGGTRYATRARVKTAFGLEVLLDLEVPAENLFDRVVRVDRLVDRLDIQAPEIGGWLHKEVKQRTQHLEKHHVSELSIGGGGTTLKLRTGADGTGPGFDVLFAKEAPTVRLTRFEQQEGVTEEPFDATEADAAKLLALLEKLSKAAAALTPHRRRIVEAKIDGEVMRTHAKPMVLVERLIATMVPVVQDIASRSQSPDELVLRRLLAGDRREEVFVSKSELKAKLELLTDGNRAMFDSLWLVPPAPPALPAKPVAHQPPPPPPPPARAPVAPPPETQPMRFRAGTPILGTHAAIVAPPPPPAARPAEPEPDGPIIELVPDEVAGTIDVALAKAADPATRS